MKDVSARCYTSVILFGLFIIFEAEAMARNRGNNIAAIGPIVVFDPYISALDIDNRFRYDVQDLQTMVSRVATGFQRVIVPLSPFDLTEDLKTSVSLLPLAIANHNNQSSSSQKLEVWLSYSSTIPNYRYKDSNKYHLNIRALIDRLKELSYQANNIHENTVTTIVLPYFLFYSQKEDYHSAIESTGGLRLGISLLYDNYMLDLNIKTHINDIQPDVMIIDYRVFDSENQLVLDFENFLAHFKDTVGTPVKPLKLAFSVTISDTDGHGHLSYSRYSSATKFAMNWGLENQITIVLPKAFDTPYEKTVERKTCGWWHLVESPFYQSTSNYRFEDKSTKNMNIKETEIDWKKLQTSTKFDREFTEIIFSLYDEKRANAYKKWPVKEMDILLNKMVEKFDKVMILFEHSTDEGFQVFVDEILTLIKIKDKITITVLIMSHVKPWEIFNNTMFTSRPESLIFFQSVSSIKTYVMEYNEDGSTQNATQANELVLEKVRITNFTIGYAFNISICAKYDKMNNQEQSYLDQTLYSIDSPSFIFYFTESKESVKLGAKRMFQQRRVLMENCRDFLTTRNVSFTKLSFLMLHYAKLENFYTNKWAIANFIEYWQLLSNWARDSEISVVFSNAADMDRQLTPNGKSQEELGWWRYQDPSKFEGSLSDDHIWIDKIEDANQRFSSIESTGLQTYKIVLISIAPLIVLVTVAILIFYFTRRHFREVYLTKLEISEFFNGQHSSRNDEGATKAVEKMPYDKSRYEIDASSFTLGDELGSGEFGIVCKGTVEKDGFTNVAIKMVNPVNIHKTAISGLLSEIKVLSYIGKHENITELIGANTQDIQMGKVYIFLELCEFGSLENHLRKMRPAIVDVDEAQESMQEKSGQISVDVDIRINKYLDLLALKKISLDPSQYQDMYRWSQEICNGMQYLAQKHVVHADLATRNVLLNSENVAKICDFGLSRRMYNYTNYVKQKQEPLPWKWMSPESLRMLQFNEKSDVWAYGVTLWEIYTLGDSPYPGLCWSLEFADMLEGGLRLKEPKYNDKNMYEMMKECWKTNPENRPTFADLQTMFI